MVRLNDSSPPAEVREHLPLLDWAVAQARAVAELDKKIEAARKRHDATAAVLAETVEVEDVEEAKDRLAAAKRAALDDPAVAKAKLELKAARKALKQTAASLIKAEKKARGDVAALVSVRSETERGIVGALKTGKVPSAFDDVLP